MFGHRLLTQALLIGGLSASTTAAIAQDRPNEFDAPEPAANSADLAARMMKLDKNSDGKLTKAEITDARLVRLWTRADADKDGVVTKSELDALDTREQASTRNSGGGPGGGPGGFGGPGGGPGGPMGMPKPGEVLPEMLRSRLSLTTDQKLQFDELQREVDARMAKILTDSQKIQIKQITTRGPGGGPGGGRGRGGPGGGGPGGGGPGGPPGGGGNRAGGFDDGGAPPPPPR